MAAKTLHKITSFIDRDAIHGRYKDGHRDLIKGLHNSLPISDSQKAEIMAYWKPFLKSWKARYSFDIKWFDIYNKTNVFGFDLKTYIPDSYYYCVVDTFFNNSQAATYLDDKNLYDMFFHDVRQPKTICRKEGDLFLSSTYEIISEKDAVQTCEKVGRVIIKPSVSSCAGHGIVVWDANKQSMDVLRDILRSRNYCVVQELVEQSDDLAVFNNTCVNTLRMITLLFEGEVHVVSAVLIAGGKDAVTNHLHSGGICCGIHGDGNLYATGFDGKLNQYNVHPNGAVFGEKSIPNYKECVDLVKRLAPRLSHTSKFIAWDITLDKDNHPVLIETNLKWGGSVQIAAGPVFGELTDSVLRTINGIR